MNINQDYIRVSFEILAESAVCDAREFYFTYMTAVSSAISNMRPRCYTCSVELALSLPLGLAIDVDCIM